MDNWVDEVIAKWRSKDLDINEGATVELIKSAESFLNFQFPADFKQLYFKMNGFAYLEWQEHMFSFWSLERIMEEFEADKDFIAFSDYSLSANHIGFRKGKDGVYKIYPSLDNTLPERIAKTFMEVVNMINSSSDDIY